MALNVILLVDVDEVDIALQDQQLSILYIKYFFNVKFKQFTKAMLING